MERKLKTRLIGATISPLSLAAVAFANLSLPHEMQQATSLVPALKSNWLMMHVSVMMVSYVLLVVGCVLALLYILVSNKTKNNEKNTTTTVNGTRLQLNYKTTENWETEYDQGEKFQQPTIILNSSNGDGELKIKLLNLECKYFLLNLFQRKFFEIINIFNDKIIYIFYVFLDLDFFFIFFKKLLKQN